jgi:hypothetical protein
VPNRIIRENILGSERVGSLDWAGEVFYRRLQSIVDDHGRYEASAQLLRSKCYPLHTDKQVNAKMVDQWLAACVKAGLVLVYEVVGKRYLEVLNFGQQRRSPSKYPQPPANVINSEQANTDAHLGVVVSVVVSEGEGEADSGADAPAPRGKKTSMPKDFGLSDRVKAWAAEKGYALLDKHLEAFKTKVAAKGYTYVDWDAAFMEAVREDWAKLRGRDRDGKAPPPDVTGPRGPDPALEKIKRDAGLAAPVPAAVREFAQRVKVH